MIWKSAQDFTRAGWARLSASKWLPLRTGEWGSLPARDPYAPRYFALLVPISCLALAIWLVW